MSNLMSIRPLEVGFRTQSNVDWLDGLPIIAQATSAGIVAGETNVGKGASLVVASVESRTIFGAHAVRITSIVGGVPQFTVTDPRGLVVAQGAAGISTYSSGIRFRLTNGVPGLAIGDTFAMGVLPSAIDLTGLNFLLEVRKSALDPVVVLSANSLNVGGVAPTLTIGALTGNVSMYVPRVHMADLLPGEYVYDILAIDAVSELRVPAFFGKLVHVAGVSLLTS